MSVAKSLVQVLMTVLAAVVPALTAGPLDAGAWINVVILAAGAVAVLLASSITDGLTSAEIIQLILAGAAALGVGAVPNGGVARHAATA